jgi:hypothetical protein
MLSEIRASQGDEAQLIVVLGNGEYLDDRDHPGLVQSARRGRAGKTLIPISLRLISSA